jgi:hypothetical protein
MFKKTYLPYYIVSVVFVTLFFIAEIINDRFWLNDFRVYYFSSLDFVQGDPIYSMSYGLGSGWFKYSPFFAMVFSFFTLFSYKIASIIFYWIISVLIIVFLPKLYEEMVKGKKNTLIILGVSFVFIADHLVRELHLGNVNFLLLVLVLFVFKLFRLQKNIFASALFAVVILLKPYFMLIGLFFLLKKEFNFLILTGAFTIMYLLLPSLFVGFESNNELLLDWVEAMKSHNSEITSFNYLSGSFKLHFGIDLSILVFILLFVAVYIYMFFDFLKRNEELAFFLLIAIIPNLVLTDTEHFLYSIPIILFFLGNIDFKTKIHWPVFVGIIGLCLYGLNWGFIWGDNTGFIVTSGIIGLGNLLIIVASLRIQKTRI